MMGEIKLLHHFLATLAYRTQKALRGAPANFGSFQVVEGVRNPSNIVCHMTSVLGYARTFYIGGTYWPQPLPTLEEEIKRFHDILQDLAKHIEKGSPLLGGISVEQLLQGPLSDAMTHTGQLAMLRRLVGSPVAPENFVFAEISPERLGPDQAEPTRPDLNWEEAPAGWIPPSPE
jgi:hypothetical protein